MTGADSRKPRPGRHAVAWSGWLLALACADATATHSVFGPYVSIQVNVDAAGQNITGDAANEPTMAINPLDPGNIVIAWRQFDSVQSSFRQGGWAHSQDGGSSWTFPGSSKATPSGRPARRCWRSAWPTGA